MIAAERRKLTAGLMVSLLLVAAPPSHSQTLPEPKPLPPIVQKYLIAMRQAWTLSVEMTQTYHFIPRANPDVEATAKLSLEKPNKFAVKFGSITAASDGLTLAEWDKDCYTQQQAPESLEGMLAKVQRGLLLGRHLDAVAANIAFVMFTHPDALAALPNMEDEGQERINGVQAHKIVAWTPDNSSMVQETARDKATFWFAADTSLPLQVVVSGAFDTYTIGFAHYALDKPIPANTFDAMPPANLSRIGLKWLKTGASAPEFTLKTPNGEAVTLSALKGQVVLLAFCPSWLPQGFTDTAISLIGKAQDAARPKKLTVLWIVETEKPDQVTAFVTAHMQVPMTVLLDPPPWPQTIEQTLYQVQATPTFYVISREGQIIAGFLGCRLDKQKIIQGDTRAAAISVLIHGGVPSNALSVYNQASDMMDEASLDDALDAAGLTLNKRANQ